MPLPLICGMAIQRIHIGLTPGQLKALDKLAGKLGLDRTNTLRYCLMRALEAEGISVQR
jgi:hypothetical protein